MKRLILGSAILSFGLLAQAAEPPKGEFVTGKWAWVQLGATEFPRGPALAPFLLKRKGNHVYGVVDGQGDPKLVVPIEDGKIEGDTLTFYIVHLDDPPMHRLGPYRNRFVGKIQADGNMVVGTWGREPGGPDDGFKGPMTLVGPLDTGGK